MVVCCLLAFSLFQLQLVHFFKAALSVTFDLFILELMFLFFKNTVKKQQLNFIWDNISCYRFYLPDYLPLNIDHSRNLPVENCGMNYTEKYATL